ncbi:MAG: AAA family ATPase, partial [Endomicrobium sp.]|nr:AAA family ATPase [Endomicrobium sp.]
MYVDKTEHIYKLINSGRVYFLSRPRRFGKSLSIGTFKELFKGNKKVFGGLYIYGKWDWSKTNPLFLLTARLIGYEVEGEVHTDRCSVKERERSDSSGNKTWERGKDREVAKSWNRQRKRSIERSTEKEMRDGLKEKEDIFGWEMLLKFNKFLVLFISLFLLVFFYNISYAGRTVNIDFKIPEHTLCAA